MAEKIEFPAFRKSVVKVGTKPNKSEPKLVTIKNTETGEVRRVKLNVAEWRMNSLPNPWVFCPKSEYKGKK